MRVRRIALAALVLGAGAVPAVSDAAEVHATIGTNAVAMPEHSTAYRLDLDGRATRIGAAPTPSTGKTSPNHRYRVELGNAGIVLIDVRRGTRRRLAPQAPAAAAYWSSQNVLAYSIHASRIERLVVLDPATGRQRRLASRICDTAIDPWSPDGTRLALAVSLPHRACKGVAGTPVVVGVTDAWRGPLRRIAWRPRLSIAEPLAWTRSGHALLVSGSDQTGNAAAAVMDLRTGRRRAAFPSFTLGGAGKWSSGQRFLALPALDWGSYASLLVVDGAFRSAVGSFMFGQQGYAWAPGRPWLAFASAQSVRVFDASTRRVIATIPVRARYGFAAESLAWAPDASSISIVAAPGLGHD
jgi:hypothetical protein